MSLRPLPILLAAALASPAIQAASYTYHGDLMDGDAPAEGAYDLRVRAFANPDASKALDEATELPDVAVNEGRFSIALDLPEDPDGVTWVQVELRKSDSGEAYERLGDPQPIAKVNSTCPGAWALDGNSGVPAGSYLGVTGTYSRLYLNAPYGVDINGITVPVKAGAGPDAKGSGPDDFADLTVHAKSTVPYSVDSADLHLLSGSGKRAVFSVSDTSGNAALSSYFGGIDFVDGIYNTTQNNGLAPFVFSGRLHSRAVGNSPTDTSGGIWFDDERANASFVGRGDNQSDWTGIFEATGGWRFTAHDNGAFGFNTGVTALPAHSFRAIADGGVEFNLESPTVNYDASFGTRPVSGDADFDAILGSRSGKTARITLWDNSGLVQIHTYDAGDTRFSLGSSGTGIAGRYLITDANGAHLTTGGSWTNGSSRAFKQAFEAIDASDILTRVLQLPLSRWRYRNSDEGMHLGPMAEDFAAAFGLGGSPQHISTVDADGVALAAIQGLNTKLEYENAALRNETEALRAALDDMLARLSALEAGQDR